jgi:hypothetical protein
LIDETSPCIRTVLPGQARRDREVELEAVCGEPGETERKAGGLGDHRRGDGDPDRGEDDSVLHGSLIVEMTRKTARRRRNRGTWSLHADGPCYGGW